MSDVLTTGLLIPSGNKKSFSIDIDTVVVNKRSIDTMIENLYLRQTHVSFTKDTSEMLESKKS